MLQAEKAKTAELRADHILAERQIKELQVKCDKVNRSEWLHGEIDAKVVARLRVENDALRFEQKQLTQMLNTLAM